MPMYGFYGRILQIDLTHERFHIDATDEEVLEKYLGCKGLASHLLYELNPPGVDPLGSTNHLIFATGMACGSNLWGSSRYGVFTKSPQTGIYSEASSGGRVPEAIDATGFDAIVITGSSSEPTVLSIFPDTVEFHRAEDIWGMDIYKAEDAVHARFDRPELGFKKSGAVVIGPAGENLVNFAVIGNDHWRHAGRTGVGAVMGSKKLKAILYQGDRKRSYYDENIVRELSRELAKIIKDDPSAAGYRKKGTAQALKILNKLNAFPSRYWSEGSCQHYADISADALNEHCDVTPHACAKCLMACGRRTTVKEGRHAGLMLEGPEYETIYAFGGLCLVDSIEEIAYLNDVCDRLGLDTISAGNLCAFAIEAGKRAKVQDVIDYGDVDGIATLLERITYREGIGDILAKGIRYAAKAWDMEDIAVHVKGLEPAGYDPRVLKGMGLAYATSDRGACHLRSQFFILELTGRSKPGDTEGKPDLFVDVEDRMTIFDTFVLCHFYMQYYSWNKLGTLIHAMTGIKASKETLRKKAASISDLVRKFNLREGLLTTDDSLPKRFYEKQENSDAVITEEEMQSMLKNYYRLRGWDAEGRPSEHS